MPAVISKSLMSAIAIVAGSFLAVPAADASTTIPDVTISAHSGNNPFVNFSASNYGSAWGNPDGTYNFNGGTSLQGFSLAWSMQIGPQPEFVVANFVVTNVSAITQTFVLEVTVPIVNPLASSLIGGSVQGTVTDLNGNGATVASNSPAPIYSALIDGSTVATLLNDPFSTSAGNFESANIGPAEFGGPVIPSQPGPAVANTIGIRLEFTLTAGDSASFTSIFVVAVPGPGGLAILAFAGVVTRGRRRRA